MVNILLGESNHEHHDAPTEDTKTNGFQEDTHISTSQTTKSDSPFFIKDLSYTREEEAQVIRILDTRLFPWILLTTFVLNMDRTNLSNAISDNLPADLGFTIDTVNLAIAIYSVLFSCACFSGAVMAKIVGPSRCSSCFRTFSSLQLILIHRDPNPHVLMGTGHSSSCLNKEYRWIHNRCVVMFGVEISAVTERCVYFLSSTMQ